jgi:hypothetical protein
MQSLQLNIMLSFFKIYPNVVHKKFTKHDVCQYVVKSILLYYYTIITGIGNLNRGEELKGIFKN